MGLYCLWQEDTAQALGREEEDGDKYSVMPSLGADACWGAG